MMLVASRFNRQQEQQAPRPHLMPAGCTNQGRSSERTLPMQRKHYGRQKGANRGALVLISQTVL